MSHRRVIVVSMDMPSDAHRRSSLIRHLRAVDANFRASATPRLDDGPPEPVGDDFTRRQLDLFQHLIRAVGSADTLWCLDVLPLPDEQFDWSGVEPDDTEYVAQVLALCDRCCDDLFDIEYRTAVRRLLALVARNDPRPLRRAPHVARCAASFVWLIGAANGDFDRGGRYPSSWLWSWFGVDDCSGRSRTVYRAAGLERDDDRGWFDSSAIGDPNLLVSHTRARLADQRDHLLDVAERRRTWSVVGTDGRSVRVNVRARPSSVVHSTKAVLRDSGRAVVLVGLGEHLEDAEFLSFSIPDAHELVRQVQAALDTALPTTGIREMDPS
jgi:hypothetical protein